MRTGNEFIKVAFNFFAQADFIEVAAKDVLVG